MQTHKKIMSVAVVAEALIIATGLGLAASQAMAAYEDHADLILVASAASFPVLLASLELLKIPAAIAVYKARWFMKPVAAILLIAGAVATFETMSGASLTWFKSTQFAVTSAQAELSAMKDRAEIGNAVDAGVTEDLQSAIDAIDQQLAAASPLTAQLEQVRADLAIAMDARSEARQTAAAEYDKTQEILQERISNGGADGAEAAKAQRVLPARPNFIDARMEEWDASYGADNAAEIARLRSQRDIIVSQMATENSSPATLALQAQRADLQRQLGEALSARQNEALVQIDLKAQIQIQELRVAELASASLVYDAASKVYGKPAAQVTSDEANTVTFWIITLSASAVALATSLGTLIATHMAEEPRQGVTIAQLLRKWWVMRKWTRKHTVEVPVEIPVEVEKEVEKIVEKEVPTLRYTYVPVPVGEDVQDAVDAILEALPADAAAELRGKLAQFTKGASVEEVRYANAA